MTEVGRAGEIDIRLWLQESLRDEKTPGAVDGFEIGQFERQARAVLSRQTDPSARARLFEELKKATLGDADFMSKLGAAADGMRTLLASPSPPLLYAGDQLDKPSPVRAVLLEILAGDHYEGASVYHAAQDLAAASRTNRTLCAAQIEQTLAEIDAAHARLPLAERGRSAEGTTTPESLTRVKGILAQGLARLRQPAFAEALDRFFAFDGATFGDSLAAVRLLRQDFQAIGEAARRALQNPRNPTGKADMAMLWRGFEAVASEHFGDRLATLRYTDARTQSFDTDRAERTSLLERGPTLLKPHGGRRTY